VVVAGLYPSLVGILLGQQKIKELARIDTVRFIVQQGLAAVLVILGWKVLGVVTGWAVGYSFFAITAYYATHSWGTGVAGKVNLEKLLSFSVPLYACDFSQLAYNWVDRALLLFYLPLSALGIYNVAFVGFSIVASAPYAMATSLFPHYSKLSSRSREKLESAVRSASRYISLIVSPLAVGLGALAPTVLRLFGPAYQGGDVALAILSLCLFASLPFFSLGSILVALGRPLRQSAVTIASVLVSILTGVVVIPRLGMNGGAIARGVGLVAYMVLTMWLVKGQIGLKFDRSAILKSAVASIIMAIPLIFLEFSLRSILFLPLYLFVGVIVYTGVLRFEKAVDREDLEFLKAFLGRRLSSVVDRVGPWLVPEGRGNRFASSDRD
jgi:O-antigen/teichoic acid export membrane protein